MNKFSRVFGGVLAAATVAIGAVEAAEARTVNVQVSQRGTSAKRTVNLDCNTVVPLQGGKLGRRVAFAAQFNLEASEAEIARYQRMSAAQRQSHLAGMTPGARSAFLATAALPAATRAQYLRARSDMRIVSTPDTMNAYNALAGHVTVAHGVKASEMSAGANMCRPFIAKVDNINYDFG